jgi:hypothetical protein
VAKYSSPQKSDQLVGLGFWIIPSSWVTSQVLRQSGVIQLEDEGQAYEEKAKGTATPSSGRPRTANGARRHLARDVDAPSGRRARADHSAVD